MNTFGPLFSYTDIEMTDKASETENPGRNVNNSLEMEKKKQLFKQGFKAEAMVKRNSPC